MIISKKTRWWRMILELLLIQALAVTSCYALVNADFEISDQDDPDFGWTLSGNIAVAGGEALMSEGSVGTPNPVTLSQTFDLAAGVSGMTITILDIGLAVNATGPPDAFEIRLTDPSTGTSLLTAIPTFTETDAFFNFQEDGILYYSSEVTIPGASASGSSWVPSFPVTIVLDLSHITTAVSAEARFDLIGFDTVASSARIDGLSLGLPPVAMSDPGIMVAEDDSVEIDVLENDDDPDQDIDPATVAPSLPSHGTATVNIVNGVITYEPDDNYAGPDEFTYIVKDAGGNASNTATVSITVTPVNDAPTITSTPVSTVDQAAAYSYTITTADVENDSITMSAEILPTWVTFDDNLDGTAVLSGVPGNSDVGLHDVKIIVTDLPGDSTPHEFTITVANVNDLPTFESTPVIAASEDMQYSYAVTVADIDNDALTITAPVLPSWLDFTPDNINRSATLAGTPLNSDVGDHLVRLVVSDSIGADVPQEFTISVANTNDIPVVTSTPVLSAVQDSPYTYDITVTDDDEGDTVTISLSPSTPAWLSLINNTGTTATLTGTPLNEHVGENAVTILAADAHEGEGTQTFTIVVDNVNDPPEFTSAPGLMATENQEYNYDITTLDIDDDDVVVTATSTLPDWLPLIDNGDGTWRLTGTPTSDHLGPHAVSITVTDIPGGLTAQQDFTITVNEVNDPPEFTTSPVTTAREDVLYTYELAATDDEDDPISFTATIIADWLTFADNDGGTATLDGTPGVENIGDHAIEIEAADDQGHTRTQNFTITVLRKDTDDDGLLDVWEEEHFGDLRFGPNDNPDGDKLINRYEFDLGRDPEIGDPDIDVLEVTAGWNLISIPDNVVNATPDNLFGDKDRGPIWAWQDNHFVTIGGQDLLNYKRGIWVYFSNAATIFLFLDVDS